MLALAHAMLCSDIIVDSQSGQVSYIKVLEKVTSAKLPISLADAKIGTLWQSDTEQTVQVRVDLLSPDNKAVCLRTFAVQFKAALQKVHININQMLLAQEGMHILALSVKQQKGWIAMARMPLSVVLNK